MSYGLEKGEKIHTATRVSVGFIALTSRMIFGLAVASNDSSFTLKMVFSFGFSYLIIQLSELRLDTLNKDNVPLRELPLRRQRVLGQQRA